MFTQMPNSVGSKARAAITTRLAHRQASRKSQGMRGVLVQVPGSRPKQQIPSWRRRWLCLAQRQCHASPSHNGLMQASHTRTHACAGGCHNAYFRVWARMRMPRNSAHSSPSGLCAFHKNVQKTAGLWPAASLRASAAANQLPAWRAHPLSSVSGPAFRRHLAH